MRTAILASQNKNKIKEIKAILEKYGLDVISRDDAGIPTDDIEETGATFEENSYLKARTIFDMIRQDASLAKYLDSPVIADDSGLMVDAMGGAPGVYSARYAGEGCTYDDNNVKMLGELKGVPYEDRGAGFVTVITLIYPEGNDIPEDLRLFYDYMQSGKAGSDLTQRIDDAVDKDSDTIRSSFLKAWIRPLPNSALSSKTQ